MDDLTRQVRIALVAVLVIFPVGIVGFMWFENMTIIDATWSIFITLTTIGYGDVYAETPEGRVFTIFIVIFGLGALASLLQATFAIFISPTVRQLRDVRRMQKSISQLENHYIICGKGEMVDKTVGYLLQSAELRRAHLQEKIYRPIDDFLDNIMGDDEDGHYVRFRSFLHKIIVSIFNLVNNQSTLLDIVVVITTDPVYASELRNAGLYVLEGNPTDDKYLELAGIDRARAMMVMLDNDTETLLTVLTAHNLAPNLAITAAVLDEDLGRKIIRVGANASITPYDTAGQFLNNATLRPAVNDFLHGFLFNHDTKNTVVQLNLWDDSPWIGKTLHDLQLKEQFGASVLGVRQTDGRYQYAIRGDYVFEEDDVLIVVVDPSHVEALLAAHEGKDSKAIHIPLWQPLPIATKPPTSQKTYTLVEAEDAIKDLSKHFIICGTDRVARRSIAKLNPERPFVIISNDNQLTSELLKRGFRVVHGNPTYEETLRRAGVHKAQAIMVAIEDKADSVLTILSCRSLNKGLLITTTAYTDDMIDKLERAGADRVVSPFHVAARFVLLKTTRPEISDFLNYILFNYQTQLETTELYMENDSPWIGKQLGELQLREDYNAGVLGIRLDDASTFIYAPSHHHIIKPQEVLIVVTPMKHSDELRDIAHGSESKRPKTLRRTQILKSDTWTLDQIKELIHQNQQQVAGD